MTESEEPVARLTPDILNRALDTFTHVQLQPAQYVVHPDSLAWAHNPVGPPPSVEALNTAIVIGNGECPEVKRAVRSVFGPRDTTPTDGDQP